MYQELYLNSKLNSDISESILNILKFMTGDMSIEGLSLTTDAIFKTDNWEYMLQSESSRFDLAANSSVTHSAVDDCYFLRVSCSLNNNEQQIEKFLGFINAYLNKEPGSFLGYVRKEDSNEPYILRKL